jgi:hypothetical protein
VFSLQEYHTFIIVKVLMFVTEILL